MVFGEHAGVRSVDGLAEVDSIENRRNLLSFALRLAGGTVAVTALGLAAAYITDPDLPGMHVGWAFLVVAFAVVVGLVAAVTYDRIPIAAVHVFPLTTTALTVMGAFVIGPALSPYAIINFAIVGVGVAVVLERRAAAFHIAVLSIGVAILVAFQAHNAAPLTRWIFVVGGINIIGLAAASLVDRIRDRAASERQARAETELARLNQLRRFLPSLVLDAVLASGSEDALQPHRREISVLFCDLRGFTAFSAAAQPEEVADVLHVYFDALGLHVQAHQATVGAFTGDGLMAFFNDPLPCDNPGATAIKLALDLQGAMTALIAQWRRAGYDLGFGVGIALGYANIGMVGFEGRRDYTALGPVVNLAARLCAEAPSGSILVDQRTYAAVDGFVDVDGPLTLELKGFHQPVNAYTVRASDAHVTRDT